MNEDLGIMLGLDLLDLNKKLPPTGKTVWVGSRVIDTGAGISSLFVYCDLAMPTIVGDTTANLLRVIPAPGTLTQLYSFANEPYYISLSRNYFNQITIIILDDTGQPVTFVGDKTIVVLNFRKVKQSHYGSFPLH
jgi:hypothetical protein